MSLLYIYFVYTSAYDSLVSLGSLKYGLRLLEFNKRHFFQSAPTLSDVTQPLSDIIRFSEHICWSEAVANFFMQLLSAHGSGRQSSKALLKVPRAIEDVATSAAACLNYLKELSSLFPVIRLHCHPLFRWHEFLSNKTCIPISKFKSVSYLSPRCLLSEVHRRDFCPLFDAEEVCVRSRSSLYAEARKEVWYSIAWLSEKQEVAPCCLEGGKMPLEIGNNMQRKISWAAGVITRIAI